MTPFLTSESLGTRTSKGSGSIPWKLYGTAWLNFNLLVRTSFQMCRSQSWDMVWKRQPAHKIHHVISWKKKSRFSDILAVIWAHVTSSDQQNVMNFFQAKPGKDSQNARMFKMHECSRHEALEWPSAGFLSDCGCNLPLNCIKLSWVRKRNTFKGFKLLIVEV